MQIFLTIWLQESCHTNSHQELNEGSFNKVPDILGLKDVFSTLGWINRSGDVSKKMRFMIFSKLPMMNPTEGIFLIKEQAIKYSAWDTIGLLYSKMPRDMCRNVIVSSEWVSLLVPMRCHSRTS